jgi:hypothetical protein
VRGGCNACVPSIFDASIVAIPTVPAGDVASGRASSHGIFQSPGCESFFRAFGVWGGALSGFGPNFLNNKIKGLDKTRIVLVPTKNIKSTPPSLPLGDGQLTAETVKQSINQSINRAPLQSSMTLPQIEITLHLITSLVGSLIGQHGRNDAPLP